MNTKAPAIHIELGTIELVTRLSADIPEFENPYGPEEYHRRLDSSKHLILVAYCQGQPAGFKVGYEKPEGFYSWMGAVLPEFRRLGLATLLAEYQETWLRGQGYSSVTFKTMNKHKSMLIFSLKRNFQITGLIPQENPLETRIILQKAL